MPTPTLQSALELEIEQHIFWRYHPSNGKICGCKTMGGVTRSFNTLQDFSAFVATTHGSGWRVHLKAKQTL